MPYLSVEHTCTAYTCTRKKEPRAQLQVSLGPDHELSTAKHWKPGDVISQRDPLSQIG